MGGSDILVGEGHRFAPATPDEEYVFGSCSPGWHSAADPDTSVHNWITFMQSQGIERVCSLLMGQSEHEPGSHLDRYREAFGEENVCHAPIPDYRLAKQETINDTILPFLAESVEHESPVVVHCLAGVGRTGQVHAAWLVARYGYGPEEAIETVKKMGRDPTETIDRGNATEEELLSLLESASGQF